jgi:plasmid stabilization system protein ParE
MTRRVINEISDISNSIGRQDVDRAVRYVDDFRTEVIAVLGDMVVEGGR